MCDVCLRNKCHPQCPNYESHESQYSTIKCSVCGEYIYDGEEYVENEDGEYRHCDCYSSIKEFVEWLGYEVKVMEGELFE